MKTLARPRDKVEIASRLRTLRPDSRRRWGRMTVHQMVCHLGDAFRLLTDETAVTPGPLSLRHTIARWIALYVPLRWPAGIPTTPDVDQEKGGTRPLEFASDLERVEHLLEQFTAGQPSGIEGRVHPVLGRMSRKAWMRWGYLHTDHHLRQFGA